VNLMAVDADAGPLAVSGPDPAGFATLYDRYAAQLYGCAYQRFGAQTAEDVVADTFLAALQQRASYDPSRAKVRPWLFGILTRKLARHCRAEKARYRALDRSAQQTVQDGPAEQVAARVTAGAVRAPLAEALRRLSEGDRDAPA